MNATYPPLIEVAVEAASPADRDVLAAVLAKMASKDPSFSIDFQASGSLIIKGVSETHLDHKIDILRRTCGIEVTVGAPQAAYREGLGRRAEIDHTYTMLSGGAGQFARVKLTFEPGEGGSGFVFSSTVVDGSVPEVFIPAVRAGSSRPGARG